MKDPRDGFMEIRFAPAFLDVAGLPDRPYPVRMETFTGALPEGGLEFSTLLGELQRWSALVDDWRDWEAPMLALARCAADGERLVGRTWRADHGRGGDGRRLMVWRQDRVIAITTRPPGEPVAIELFRPPCIEAVGTLHRLAHLTESGEHADERGWWDYWSDRGCGIAQVYRDDLGKSYLTCEEGPRPALGPALAPEIAAALLSTV